MENILSLHNFYKLYVFQNWSAFEYSHNQIEQERIGIAWHSQKNRMMFCGRDFPYMEWVINLLLLSGHMIVSDSIVMWKEVVTWDALGADRV